MNVGFGMCTTDRFFETNVELDLTVVSCEIVAPDLSYSLPLDTTNLRRRAIRKDHPIFIMGCQVRKPDDIVIMEGCIAGVIRSEPLQNGVLLRFQTAGDEVWMPGTAGFDEFGSFAFIVTKPPAKLQEDMQSPSFKLSNEQVGIRGSGLSFDRSQVSPITARFFAHETKQWATCVQAIKDWVQPLWKENRNEVFEGSMQPLKLAKQLRRPSTPGDALFRQKSFTSRNSISTIDEGQGPLRCKPGKDVEKTDTRAWEPAVSSHETKAETPPSPCMEEGVGVKAMVPAAINQLEAPSSLDQESDKEMKKALPSKRAITYKQRLSKNIIFTALSKQNNGLKKLTQRAMKPKKPAMESVSVQTMTPPDAEKERPEEVEDQNLVVSTRRASEESSEAGVRSEVKKANIGRERWSLPGELDPILKKADNKQPSTSKGSNAMASNARRAMQSKRPGASAWIDNYYSLGRSRSDHSLRFSGVTSNRAQRDVPLVVDDFVPGVDNGYAYDPQESEENLLSMQHSLSSPSSSLYNKPTISYMQRRSLNQREQIARRASQSSNSPRWS
ncbi:hypothetical protein L7F22_033219 [Adiantum nelumboides]|nr:hypothetical protein [Adiantum nelumboides]